MILLARADEHLAQLPVATRPLWQSLGAGAMVAVGFLAFGAALNDFLDAKHDRAFAPDRPLPAGNLRPRRAIQIAVIALFVGLLGALSFGTSAALVGMALAATALVYDAFAKHVPAVGILVAGVATALSMLVPCVEATSLVPVWLAMSQTMGIGLLAYILGEKRPVLSTRSIVAGSGVWVAASAGLFALEAARNGDELLAHFTDPVKLAVPAAAVVLGALAGAWKLRGARGPRANDRVLRYGSLWKSLVAAAWLVATGLAAEGAWIAGIAAGIFAVVAIVREVAPHVAEPVSWRS
jgi:4-hydroxybenzoate polyprenyltransferase